MVNYYNVSRELHIDKYFVQNEFCAVDIDDDNIWEQPIIYTFGKSSDGKLFLLSHETPDGYGEFTYEPDTEHSFEDSLEKLVTMHVESEHRPTVIEALKKAGYNL